MENVGLMVALAGAMTKAPSSAQVASAVDAWLEDHPDATTTVEDGSITNAKLATSFVTPGTASAYSSSATYAVGDYVFYGGTLYRCITAITTAEAWTAAHWTAAVLGDDVGALKTEIDNYDNGFWTIRKFSTWTQGGLSNGQVTTGVTYRLVSVNPIVFDKQTTIYIASGRRASFHLLNDDETLALDSGWQSGSYTIPANTKFRVLISSVPYTTAEEASVVATIAFTDWLTLNTNIDIRIEQAENTCTIVPMITDVVFSVETVKYYADVSSASNGCSSGTYWLYSIPVNGIIRKVHLPKALSGGTATIGVFAKTDSTTYSLLYSAAHSVQSGENTIDFVYEANSDVYVGVMGSANIVPYVSSGGSGKLIQLNSSYVQSQALAGYQFGVDVEILKSNIPAVVDEKSVIKVAKDGSGDFTSINSAMAYADTYMSASKPVTIILYDGVYEEVVNALGQRNLSIVGVNRNTCIIKDTTGLYSNCPLRISGNAYIANLSIIANNESGTTLVSGGEVVANTSYGLHIDDRHADDDNEYKVTVENCYIFSAQNPAVGIGLDKNQTVELINCELVRKDSSDILNSSSVASSVWGFKKTGGALFYHALYSGHYISDDGYQKLVVKDCIMRNNEANVALGESGGMENQVTLEFINNVGYSDVNGTTYVKGLSGATLSPLSFGNNCNAMNYTE